MASSVMAELSARLHGIRALRIATFANSARVLSNKIVHPARIARGNEIARPQDLRVAVRQLMISLTCTNCLSWPD
jgi:hypothetical protein